MPRIPANLALSANPIPVPPTPQDTGADRAALAAAAPRMALISGIGNLIGQAQGHVEEYVAQQRQTEENSDLSIGLAEYKARLDRLDHEIERKRQSGTLGDLEKEYADGLARLDSDFNREWVEGTSGAGIKNVRWDSTRSELKARTTALRAGHGTAASLQILAAREQESANRFDLARRTAVSTGSIDAVGAAYSTMRESNIMDPQLLSQMEAADRSAAEQNDIGRRLVGIQAASLDGYGLDDEEALSALEAEISDATRYPSLSQEQRDRARLDVGKLRTEINKEREFSLAKFKQAREVATIAAQDKFSAEFLANPAAMTPDRARAIAAEAGDADLYSKFLDRMNSHLAIGEKARTEAEKVRTAKATEEDKAAKAALEKSQVGAYVDYTRRALRASTPLDKVNLLDEIQQSAKDGDISESQYNALLGKIEAKISAQQQTALDDVLAEYRGLAMLDTAGTPRDDADDSELYLIGEDDKERIDSPSEWFALVEGITSYVQANPDAGVGEIQEFGQTLIGKKKDKIVEAIWKQDAAETIRARARALRNAPRIISEDRISDRMGKWQQSTQGARMAPGGAYSGRPPLPAVPQTSTIPTPTPAPVRIVVP